MNTAINLSVGYKLDLEEECALIKAAGFDGIFPYTAPTSDFEEIRRIALKNGLVVQSVHGAYKKMKDFWSATPEGDEQERSLLEGIRICSKLNVPYLVVHPVIGMNEHTPNEIGLERFGRLLDAAEAAQVRIAMENLEGMEYFQAVRSAYGTRDALGYCWDTGHELCYDGGQDIPSYSDGKLYCLHLNDNLGQTGDEITWLDDSHLMPFDGKVDWNDVAQRLNREGFDGFMTLELETDSKPGRNTHAIYDGLTPAQFYQRAFDRLQQIIALRG